MSITNKLTAGIEEEGLFRRSPPILRPSDENITTGQRMLSACLGSLVTSLVVTPFDVIRIRIQQQEILAVDRECCAPSAAKKPVLGSLNAHPLTISKAAAEASPELFWMGGQYCRSAENCLKITSTFQGFSTIAKNEGVVTLWRGLSLTLFMAVPSNIIYFTGYEYIRDRLPMAESFLNPLVCGSLARVMSATCVAPVELLKTRLQSIPTTERPGSAILNTLLKDTFALVQRNGIGTLFTGLQITLWRDVPFSGIYWSCYELLKSRISDALQADFNTKGGVDQDAKVFTTSFLSGSIAGSIAAFFTNPFDVGKTRLQITEQHAGKKPHMFKYLFQIYKNEGLGSFYVGFGPRVMKVAPSCAIMISSYEIGKKIFKNGNEAS